MAHGGAMVDHGARLPEERVMETYCCNIYKRVTCCALEQASNKLPENKFSTKEALASSRHD